MNGVYWTNMGQSSMPAALSNVVAISAGYFHSMALQNDGRIVIWGDNTYGQQDTPAGLNNFVAIADGWYHNLALGDDGSVTAWGMGTVNSSVPHLGQAAGPGLLTNAVASAGGGFFSLAARQGGGALGWGGNDYNQQSGASAISKVVALAAGYDFGLALQSSAPSEVPFLIGTVAGQVQVASSGGVLQSAAQPGGTYNDVPGAVSPLRFTPSQQPQFFRVRVQP